MLIIIKQRLLKKIHQNKELHASNLDQYYFGYGANANPSSFAKRLKNFKLIGPVKLNDFKLEFNAPCEYKGKGFAGVVEAKGNKVYGTLYKVSREGLELLDILEWVPFKFYSRNLMPVVLNDTSVVFANVYVTTYPKQGLYPSKGYLNMLLNAAKDLDFPEEYAEYLKAHKPKDKFELDHGFNLEDPGKERFFPAGFYRVHDRLRERLSDLI